MELGIFQDPLISDAGCRKYPAAYNCVIIKFCKHKVPYRYNVSLQANSARLRSVSTPDHMWTLFG